MTVPVNPDTMRRAFELIDAYSLGQTTPAAEILSLIPHEELIEVTAFALGMLGGLYREDPTARDALDRVRRSIT